MACVQCVFSRVAVHIRMPIMERFPRPLQHHCDDFICAPQYDLWAGSQVVGCAGCIQAANLWAVQGAYKQPVCGLCKVHSGSQFVDCARCS